MDSEESAANGTHCAAFQKKSHIPPSFPGSLRNAHLCAVPPPLDITTELRSTDRLIFCKKQNWQLFSSNRSIWVSKNAKFYTDSKSKDIIEKRHDKKIIIEKLLFCQILKNNFSLVHFFSISSYIWKKHKTPRILVPILTYFNTKYFFQKTGQIFFPQIGQCGFQKTQNFMLIPNLKMKLRKGALITSYFKKLPKKQFF